MVIYIEIIFISNFFIDGFLFCLANMFLKAKNDYLRVFMASIIGGLGSAIYPFVGNYKILIKIFLVIILPLIYKKCYRIKEYLLSIITFITVSFLTGGAAFFLNGFSAKLSFTPITYGIFPILFCSSGIIVICLCGGIIRNIAAERINNGCTYKVKIFNQNTIVSADAYYDTGNRVYTNNGECVVFVPLNIYNKFLPAIEERITVATVSGISQINSTAVDIDVFFENNRHKIYRTNIAVANNCNDGKLILHAEMQGD